MRSPDAHRCFIRARELHRHIGRDSLVNVTEAGPAGQPPGLVTAVQLHPHANDRDTVRMVLDRMGAWQHATAARRHAIPPALLLGLFMALHIVVCSAWDHTGVHK